MNNLADRSREKAEERIRENITVKCKKCQGKMVRVTDLSKKTIIGYSCKDCTHYHLFY